MIEIISATLKNYIFLERIFAARKRSVFYHFFVVAFVFSTIGAALVGIFGGHCFSESVVHLSGTIFGVQLFFIEVFWILRSIFVDLKLKITKLLLSILNAFLSQFSAFSCYFAVKIRPIKNIFLVNLRPPRFTSHT